MPRYSCAECGNTETFTSKGKIEALAKIDGSGNFIEWIDKHVSEERGSFCEPFACEICGHKDITDKEIS